MPSKYDNVPLNDSFLKRNAKLLPCQKESIFRMHHTQSFGINELSRLFKVNKRLIQFICYPDRHEKNLADRAARGGSKKYYNKDKHKKAMKDHRHYKKEVFDNSKNQQDGKN